MKVRIIFFALLFAAACSTKKKELVETPAAAVNDLPVLSITLMSGDTVRLESLQGKTVLVFFSPDCDHCQREAADIREHLDAFREYQMYFIAARGSREIEQFAKTYGLSGVSNVYFGQAEVPDVVNVMGAIGTPTLYIYSSERHLVKKFENETKMEEVIKFL